VTCYFWLHQAGYRATFGSMAYEDKITTLGRFRVGKMELTTDNGVGYKFHHVADENGNCLLIKLDGKHYMVSLTTGVPGIEVQV
jgi:hypothetical protein